MHEIKSHYHKIDKKDVVTFSRYIESANILEVEAGTNGYQGGDSGHGSRTYIRIEDMGSTDIRVKEIPANLSNGGVEIILGGDCELDTIIRALKFITKVLEDQANDVHD